MPLASEMTIDEDFRRATEEVLLAQAAKGEGVILGRGAAIVLGDRPEVLRVRLDGPPGRRAAQAASYAGIELTDAQETLKRIDRAHAGYTRRFYSVDINDPALYDIVVDSTRIDLDTCVELLEAAARARTR
jgi:cytidylate kinase